MSTTPNCDERVLNFLAFIHIKNKFCSNSSLSWNVLTGTGTQQMWEIILNSFCVLSGCNFFSCCWCLGCSNKMVLIFTISYGVLFWFSPNEIYFTPVKSTTMFNLRKQIFRWKFLNTLRHCDMLSSRWRGNGFDTKYTNVLKWIYNIYTMPDLLLDMCFLTNLSFIHILSEFYSNTFWFWCGYDDIDIRRPHFTFRLLMPSY